MDPKDIIKSYIAGIVRLALAGVAGYSVKKGLVDQDTATAAIGAVTTGVIAVAWSLYNKYGVQQKVSAALGLPAGSTPEQLKASIANEKALG